MPPDDEQQPPEQPELTPPEPLSATDPVSAESSLPEENSVLPPEQPYIGNPAENPASEPLPPAKPVLTPATNDDGIDNQQINSVDRSLWHYILSRKKWQLWLFIIGMIAWEILSIIAFIRFAQKGNGQLSGNAIEHVFGGIVIFPFIIASAEYYQIKKRFEAALFRQFATANHFTFNATSQLDEAYGSIFRIKGAAQVSDIVSGEYDGSAMRLFLYQLHIGKYVYQDTVMELDLHGLLPNVLMISKLSKYNQVDLVSVFKKSTGVEKTVNLEGDFASYFTLYSSEYNQVAAREVFTPDIMALMEDASKHYSVETVGNRVYIYANHFVSTTSELQDLFSLAKKLISKLAPLSARMAHDPTMTMPAPNSIKLRKQYPVLDKVSSYLLLLVYICGILFVFYLAFVAKPPPSHAATLQPRNPAYDTAVTEASSLDAESSLKDDLGPEIVAAGKRALANATNNSEREYANYWIGDGLFWEGNNPAAATYEKKAVAYMPNDPYPYVLEGNILVDEQQYQAALTVANQALARNPNLATAYRLKAIVLANLNQKSQAVQLIEKAMELDEGPTKAQFKASDLNFYSYINNTKPPLYISP